MNVLFDMLSGGKEMAPGGGKGRGRGPKAKRQVQGEWKRDGMLPGRVFTSSSPLVLKKKKKQLTRLSLSALLLDSAVKNSQVPISIQLASFTKNYTLRLFFFLYALIFTQLLFELFRLACFNLCMNFSHY